MPTDLQIMYAAAREGDPIQGSSSSMGKALGAAGARKPRGHYAALRLMARRTGIDQATIELCLKRANTADAIDAKNAKRAKKEKS